MFSGFSVLLLTVPGTEDSAESEVDKNIQKQIWDKKVKAGFGANRGASLCCVKAGKMN